MRDICITPQFEKDLRIIPAYVKEQADAVLFLLQNNPVDLKLGVKKMTAIHPPVWRIRIGAYRLVYMFTKTHIILLRFRHRKDVYRNL